MGTEDTGLPELAQVDRTHYKVESELARGGMGRILQARDRRHGRAVAIKELLADTPALRARLRREALITARLQHPAIVPVYEAGRWPTGEPFYAMKLVEGRSLDQVIAERPTVQERLGLLHNVIAVAEAIAYAHERQVIHRDLKPANVLVGGFGETVVIDWGLAKELGASDDGLVPPTGPSSAPPAASAATIEVELTEVPAGVPAPAGGLTVAGRALGTPAYMAPEQARGETLDARADVYALGAILYHLLAGRMPYADSKASTGPDLLRHVVNAPPTPLLELEPDVPRDLSAIVDRAMARDANERYGNAKELAEDLRRFETGQLVGARQYSAAELFRRWLGRNRVAVGFATVVVLLLVVGGAISVTRIVRERDRAEEAQRIADDQRQAAEAAQARAEQALTDKQKAQAGEKEATLRAATADTVAIQATGMAKSSQKQAEEATRALLALWVEAKLANRLQDCYLARYVAGQTRLPTTMTLTVSDRHRVTGVDLAGSPAELSRCVRVDDLAPPMVPPGSYAFPIDVDPQTAEARLGVWMSGEDWFTELLRRRYSVAVTRCYQARAIAGLAEKRTVKTSFTIQSSGKVAVSASKVTPTDAEMSQCLRAEVDGWQLPRPVDAEGKPAAVPVALAEMPRPPPPAGVEICHFGHSLFDPDGALDAARRLHACWGYGRYDARDGRRNLLGWHSHDPVAGNAR